MLLARVCVKLKKGVLDPQGKAVKGALTSLGFEGVNDVRIGKNIELILEDSDITEASEKVRMMCDKLLANPVIEDYTFEITEVQKR